jgi:type VI secretion system protein ImpC
VSDTPHRASPPPGPPLSRLNLTYLSNISGSRHPCVCRSAFSRSATSQESSCAISGCYPRFRERAIRSFVRSPDAPSVDDVMAALAPCCRLPGSLATQIPGRVIIESLSADVWVPLTDVASDVAVSGTARFVSPRADNGAADIDVAGLVLTGTIKARALDGVFALDADFATAPDWTLRLTGVFSVDLPDGGTGEPAGRLAAFLKGVEIRVPRDCFDLLSVGVSQGVYRLGPRVDPTAQRASAGSIVAAATRALPLTSLAAFTPDGVVANLPELRREPGLLDAVLHDEEFRSLERNWRGLSELVTCVTAEDVIIDLLDISLDELRDDMADNAGDPFGSALFEKVYVDEYDRYGGRPFAVMIGFYEHPADDADLLRTLMKVCAAAHCPFVSNVGASFFGYESMEELAAVTDLDAVMKHPRMAKWSELRDYDWSAYIGLALPGYLARPPWNSGRAGDPSGNAVGYVETVSSESAARGADLLWGYASVLFARNIIRSYEASGWAQHIRGPMGGGSVEGLCAYTYGRPDGTEVLLDPVQITIPDHHEYQFARNGFIALVRRKGEARATFLSAPSIMRPRDFIEQLATRDAHLRANLAYTFSIAPIAHHVKVMMREYIGSTADAPYIQQVLAGWLSRFVTTVVNPDDLTLRYYPFKAVSVVVEPRPGPHGWYKATISALPHAQFEGMDVELRLEVALGGKA